MLPEGRSERRTGNQMRRVVDQLRMVGLGCLRQTQVPVLVEHQQRLGVTEVYPVEASGLRSVGVTAGCQCPRTAQCRSQAINFSQAVLVKHW